MKLFFRILGVGFYIIIALLLVASVGSAIIKQPLLVTIVRSYSMYPVLDRGDAVFIKRVGSGDRIKNGDIIVFKVDSGSYASQGWIMHRIVGGNQKDGFITKGDANEQADQAFGGSPLIKPEWVVSKAVTLGKYPLKLPLLGYIPLLLEVFQKNPLTLPVITVILAVAIGISEIVGAGRTRKKRKKSSLDLPLIYFLGGLTIVIVLGASMLSISQRLTVQYEVSRDVKGVMMGSEIGILKVGERLEQDFVELGNSGIFPVTVTITHNDPQIKINHDKLSIKPDEKVKTLLNIKADTPGKCNSKVWVGVFFPILPMNIINFLAKKSYWLALLIVSTVPGLPVMLYPLLDYKIRKRTKIELRRQFRRLIKA
jgi:signal peptidase